MAVELPPDIIDMETEPESINLLVIGESGAGKTPFAGSSDNCLILRAERGTTSAAVRGSKAKIWDVRTWARYTKAKKWLDKAAADPDGIPFDWVVLDSVSALQTVLLRYILAKEYRANPGARDLDIPQIQDHQKWQNQFKRTIQELVDMEVNFAATALPMLIESDDDEGNTESNILPQVLGKDGAIAWTIAGMFNSGGRIRLVPKEDGLYDQRLSFYKDGNWWGRDRTEALGRSMLNPTLTKIQTKINASKKG